MADEEKGKIILEILEAEVPADEKIRVLNYLVSVMKTLLEEFQTPSLVNRMNSQAVERYIEEKKESANYQVRPISFDELTAQLQRNGITDRSTHRIISAISRNWSFIDKSAARNYHRLNYLSPTYNKKEYMRLVRNPLITADFVQILAYAESFEQLKQKYTELIRQRKAKHRNLTGITVTNFDLIQRSVRDVLSHAAPTE